MTTTPSSPDVRHAVEVDVSPAEAWRHSEATVAAAELARTLPAGRARLAAAMERPTQR